eukprot:scaffold4346_cov52-Attheya_sp.AAC.5
MKWDQVATYDIFQVELYLLSCTYGVHGTISQHDNAVPQSSQVGQSSISYAEVWQCRSFGPIRKRTMRMNSRQGWSDALLVGTSWCVRPYCMPA